MQMKIFNLTVALSATLTTNLLNPPAASGGVNGGSSGQAIYISKARVINTTSSDKTVSLWKGATGANASGTEWAWSTTTVPAYKAIEVYFPDPEKFTTTDFLVGGCSVVGLTLQLEGRIGVA